MTTNTTKNYELTILADETAPQEEIDGLTEKIKGYGKITSFEDAGVKRLAYPMHNHEKARYLYYTLELEDGMPAKLSSNLNIDDDVMRYLLVNTTKKYELTILVNESADKAIIDKLTEKIKGYGKITKFEDDGVKRLAYAIRGNEKARYLYYILELENGVPAKLSSHLNIDDDVLRHLLVLVTR